jgi:hypothetical protein
MPRSTTAGALSFARTGFAELKCAGQMGVPLDVLGVGVRVIRPISLRMVLAASALIPGSASVCASAATFRTVIARPGSGAAFRPDSRPPK